MRSSIILISSQKETKLTTNNDLYTAWLKEGNEPTVLPMKETATHSLRTKSHMKGGKHSRYNMGGRNSKQSRSARYVKHA